jgi:hypothetical protein
MAFEDDYVAALNREGVHLNRADVPSSTAVAQGLTELNTFITSLEPDTAVAIEDVTGSFPILSALSDPSVGIAAVLAPIFRACDSSGTRLSLTTLIQISRATLPLLPPPPPPPRNPTIDSLDAAQVTLRDVAHILVHWSSSQAVDKYHLMFTSAYPPPNTVSGWTEIEIESENSRSFRFRLSPTPQQGETWSFKVQGCRSFDIGSDACSPFSETKSVTTPRNTHSLRTFLQLSGVPINTGIRSLGWNVSSGVRAMMHL